MSSLLDKNVLSGYKLSQEEILKKHFTHYIPEARGIALIWDKMTSECFN